MTIESYCFQRSDLSSVIVLHRPNQSNDNTIHTHGSMVLRHNASKKQTMALTQVGGTAELYHHIGNLGRNFASGMYNPSLSSAMKMVTAQDGAICSPQYAQAAL